MPRTPCADCGADLFHDAFAYRPLPPSTADGPLTRRFKGRFRGVRGLEPARPDHQRPACFAMCRRDERRGPRRARQPGPRPARPGAGAADHGAAGRRLLAVHGRDPGGHRPGDRVRRRVAVAERQLPLPPVRARDRGDTHPTAHGRLDVGADGGLRHRRHPASPAVTPSARTGAQMLFLSALVLLGVAVWQIRREARQEVTAQQTVTAHERSRRTLLEERTTIARELHDVVAHHMSVVAIQAEAAPYRVENPPPELERAFVTIRENAVAALTELRRVLGVVRAEDYGGAGRPAAHPRRHGRAAGQCARRRPERGQGG
ncbi:sensor histidine kinase [Streptomyces sp. L7]